MASPVPRSTFPHTTRRLALSAVQKRHVGAASTGDSAPAANADGRCERRAAAAYPALGAILIERGVITAEQLEMALQHQRHVDRRLGHVLIDMGYATEDVVLGALGVQLGLPTARVNAYTVDGAALKALPEKVARGHLVFPLQKMGSILTVAVAMPPDLETLGDLRFASGCEIRLAIALEDEITAALDRYYQGDALPYQLEAAQERVTIETPFFEARHDKSGDARPGGRRVTDLVDPDEIDQAAALSAVTIVSRLLARAAADGASDIHLEPTQHSFRVRLRVDGTFRDVAEFVPVLAPALVARLKVLAGMDISEHRLPQDGRFTATVGVRRLDLRSSTYPTVYGEKVVLRVLDRSGLRLDLSGVGMRGDTLEQFRDLIRRPEGMLLLTGPTGSGKTSTLYAALTELVDTGKHIITIEDPVEYALAGINQGQTNDRAGFTFARGLRAMLRQDPDVIMVGEIRDTETLETAVEASLTGHLVLSTLHTNSTVATPARLVDMGVEPYLLSSGLLGIIAQRLVRRICGTCRVEVPTPAGMAHLFPGRIPSRMFRGAGCADCRGSGYRGRFAIHELLIVNAEVRELIVGRATESQLLDAARRAGLRTLREECLHFVCEGDTSLEEVVRVTQERS